MDLVLDTPATAPVRLSDLRTGEAGAVSMAALGAGDRELLQALGLAEAARVRICQTGNPCIVQVRATRIGLADTVARQILVERAPPLP